MNLHLGCGRTILPGWTNLDGVAWRMLDAQGANPYWSELEHYHNFSRRRLYQLLEEQGFEPLLYGVSERYRLCMEVIARKAAM